MLWLTSKLNNLAEELTGIEMRTIKRLAFFKAMIVPLDKIRKEILYQNQHDGRKIYLEKVLNEFHAIAGYNPEDHQATKLIYIGNNQRSEGLFIFQDAELDVTFLEDDDWDSDLDTFVNEDDLPEGEADFTIFIPDTITYDEVAIATQMELYSFYYGKEYTIETYTI